MSKKHCTPASDTIAPTPSSHHAPAVAAASAPNAVRPQHTWTRMQTKTAGRRWATLFSCVSAALPKKPYAIESSESASDEAKSARPSPPKTSVRMKAPAVTMPRTTLSIPVSNTLSMTKRLYSFVTSSIGLPS